MTWKHYLGVLLTGAIIALVFVFGDFTPRIGTSAPEKAETESAQEETSSTSGAGLLAERMQSNVSEIAGFEIGERYGQILESAEIDSIEYKAVLDSLLIIGLPLEAGVLLDHRARKQPTEEHHRQAGEMLGMAMDFINDTLLRSQALQLVRDNFEQLTEIAPQNADYVVSYAETFLDDNLTMMTGITRLIELTKVDSMHPRANLLLGKFGIVSGQYEKAVNRLEKVISLQTQNAEAYFLLAEAYMGTGQAEKARETFESCRGLIDDEALKTEIDRIIGQLDQQELKANN